MRIVSAALFFPLMILQGCSSSPGSDPLVLGHISSFSGDHRDMGQSQKSGIATALAVDKNKGAVAAGKFLTVLHVDDFTDPGQARSEAVRLLTVNKARCLLIGTDSATAGALIPDAARYKVPMLTSAELLSAVPGPALSLQLAPQQYSQQLVNFILTHLKPEHILVLARKENRYADEVGAAIVRYCQQKEARVSLISYDSGMDWEDLRSKDAKAVVLVGTAEDCRQLQSWRARSAKPSEQFSLIFAGEAMERARVMATATDRELYVASIYAEKGYVEKTKKFVGVYEKVYGTPPDQFALQGYEMIQILAQAFRKGVENEETLPKPGKAKERVFDGINGKIRFKEQYAIRPLYFLSLSTEKPTIVQEWIPAKK